MVGRGFLHSNNQHLLTIPEAGILPALLVYCLASLAGSHKHSTDKKQVEEYSTETVNMSIHSFIHSF